MNCAIYVHLEGKESIRSSAKDRNVSPLLSFRDGEQSVTIFIPDGETALALARAVEEISTEWLRRARISDLSEPASPS